jgi:hypothetical protein
MHRSAALAIALLVIAARVEAKGPTVKLTLTGPGLARAIEITDRGLLDGSNVWEGAFIGETVAAAPTVNGPIYAVTFDVKLPEWQRAGVKTMYTVSLARDARTGALWLYLPGRGEPGYALNVRTMLRDTQDGHWHRPSPAWASALEKYLP